MEWKREAGNYEEEYEGQEQSNYFAVAVAIQLFFESVFVGK